MKIDFTDIPVTDIPNFKGGEKLVSAQMLTGPLGKVMRGTLIPGASIGLHTHETSSEIVYILSGTAACLYDGTVETLSPGQCHVCPKGHTHSLRNEGDVDVVFFAVVPEQ